MQTATATETATTSDALSPLEKARLARKAKLESGIPIEHLTPIQHAIKNSTSRNRAIQAACYCCQGGSADPGVKWRIGNCEVGPLQESGDGCSLYRFRPYQKMLGKPMPGVLGKDFSGDEPGCEEDKGEEGDGLEN